MLLGNYIGWPMVLSASVSVLLCVLLLILMLRSLYTPVEELIQAIETGVSSFKDGDFSIRIHHTRNDELANLVKAYNQMAATLSAERMSLFQRELLLDTIIQNSPLSVVLTDSRGFILYANSEARSLFGQRSSMVGKAFAQLQDGLPAPLRDATRERTQGLISMQLDNEKVSYYLHCQTFAMNASEHELFLYKNMSTELSRQEIDLWKNAIRLISHELNNSLAPINSLANSASKILQSSRQTELLPELIDTIRLRSTRLKDFLQHYAAFARLPAPIREPVLLKPYVDNLLNICPFVLTEPLPDCELDIDAGQIEQVLINLYKNASEAGSETQDITLKVNNQGNVSTWQVSDRGKGMTNEQIQNALLPFFSTKSQGTGLGLSLCHEIISAHGGTLRLQNRHEGGLNIVFTLPLVAS